VRSLAPHDAGKRGLVRGLAGKVTLPIHQLTTQPLKIELRKRMLSSLQISHPAIKNRSRANQVLPRLMMKSDRQLNQALHMKACRTPPEQWPPNVLERLVRVVKVSLIEEVNSVSQAATIDGRFTHPEMRPNPVVLEIYSFP